MEFLLRETEEEGGGDVSRCRSPLSGLSSDDDDDSFLDDSDDEGDNDEQEVLGRLQLNSAIRLREDWETPPTNDVENSDEEEEHEVPIKQLIGVLCDSPLVSFKPWDSNCEPSSRLEKALALYRDFLFANLHCETAMDVVMEADNKTLIDFYGPPGEEPKFLSFSFESGDVGKMSRRMGVDIVIYFDPTKNGGAPRKYLDTRLLSSLTQNEATTGTTAAQAARLSWPVLYFKLNRNVGSNSTLNLLDGEPTIGEYRARLSEQLFISENNSGPPPPVDREFCYAKALIQTIAKYDNGDGEGGGGIGVGAGGGDNPEAFWVRLQALPPCPSLKRLLLALSNPSWPGRAILDEVLRDRRLVLATHTHTAFRYKRNHFTPRGQTFQILAGYPGRNEVRKEVLPVCVSYANFLYVPRRQYWDVVVRGSKFVSKNALKMSDIARMGGGKTDILTTPEDEVPDATSPCSCKLCLDSAMYVPNFPERPTQQVQI